MHFLKENCWISIKISLKYVLKSPIDDMPTFVQIMAWHRTGVNPLSEPTMDYVADAYMRHSASMLTNSNHQQYLQSLVVLSGAIY